MKQSRSDIRDSARAPIQDRKRTRFSSVVMVREVGKVLAGQQGKTMAMEDCVRKASCFTLSISEKVVKGLATVLDLLHSELFAISIIGEDTASITIALTSKGKERFEFDLHFSDFPGICDDGVSHPLLAKSFRTRKEVFVQEMQFTMTEEFDPRDRNPTARHFLATTGKEDDSDVLGAARVLVEGMEKATLDRLCVIESRRGFGVGKELLGAVENWVLAQGCKSISVQIRPSSSGSFYEQNGYTIVTGQPPEEYKKSSAGEAFTMVKMLVIDDDGSCNTLDEGEIKDQNQENQEAPTVAKEEGEDVVVEKEDGWQRGGGEGSADEEEEEEEEVGRGQAAESMKSADDQTQEDEDYSNEENSSDVLSGDKVGVTPEEDVKAGTEDKSGEIVGQTQERSATEEDKPLYVSEDGSWGHFWPAESRDSAMFNILNDEDTMLPWLPTRKFKSSLL